LSDVWYNYYRLPVVSILNRHNPSRKGDLALKKKQMPSAFQKKTNDSFNKKAIIWVGAIIGIIIVAMTVLLILN
jgi:hypothetical protein